MRYDLFSISGRKFNKPNDILTKYDMIYLAKRYTDEM